MKNVLLLFLVLLTGCADPLSSMTPSQLEKVSDADLCFMLEDVRYKNEPVRQLMRKRNTNCSPEYRYCVDNGFTAGTPQYLQCLQNYQMMVAQEQRARAVAYEQEQARLARQAAQRNAIIPKQTTPQRTNCRPDGLGGINCTTW